MGRCLSFDIASSSVTELRLQLLASPSVWPDLTREAARRNMLPVLEARLRAHGLIPPGRPENGQAKVSVAAFFDDVAKQHQARRAAFSSSLDAIVSALNAADIVPLLIKGAVSLWLRRDTWRTMRDLDVLVLADETNDALAALAKIGFVRGEGASGARPHHEEPLFHPSMPGWLELHSQALNTRGEGLLPNEEVIAQSLPSSQEAGTVRLLPEWLFVLHGLVHHHVHHRSFVFNTVNLKGLYEFAHAAARLNEEDARRVTTRAQRHPRLAAGLDLWVAAARDFYSMPLSAAWTVKPDAMRRWERILRDAEQEVAGGRFRAAFDEMSMATSGSRLRTAPGRPDSPAFAAMLDIGYAQVAPSLTVRYWRDWAQLSRKSAGIVEDL